MSREKQSILKNEITIKKIKEHPAHLMVYLTMFSSGIIFLFLIIAHVATLDRTIAVSNYFSLSTAVLLMSTYPLSRLHNSFQLQDFRQIIKSLITALFAGCLFMVLQIAGWIDMQNSLDAATSLRSTEFLYLLSGLHLLHVVILMLITSYFTVYFAKKFSDPIQCLITITNPFEHLKLKLIAHSWYFLHIVWATIFVIFLLLNHQ